MLTRRESEELDRHITGNYGEDQFRDWNRFDGLDPDGPIPEEDYIPRHKQKGRGKRVSKCYHKGSGARKGGEPKRSNPFPEDTYEFYEWRAGWLGMDKWARENPQEQWPEPRQ